MEEKISFGKIKDKYLGFNIRKGSSCGGWGYFATKKGKVIPLCTQRFMFCREILRAELKT